MKTIRIQAMEKHMTLKTNARRRCASAVKNTVHAQPPNANWDVKPHQVHAKENKLYYIAKMWSLYLHHQPKWRRFLTLRILNHHGNSWHEKEGSPIQASHSLKDLSLEMMTSTSTASGPTSSHTNPQKEQRMVAEQASSSNTHIEDWLSKFSRLKISPSAAEWS